MPNDPTDLPIQKDQFLSFDGLSVRDKIISRLNATGILTDQAFLGSNISVLNDIIAITISQLMFYLNKNANEVMFTEAQLYENVNNIVKAYAYNPVGYQTALVPYDLYSTGTLSVGTYTIPRYTFVDVNGTKYTFMNDVEFDVYEGANALVNSNDTAPVLYQGKISEYPEYTANGSTNEEIALTVGDTIIVDHFSIDVYVESDGVWEKWTRTEKLFLNNATDKVFELRLNSNRTYDVIFGDSKNGKQLERNQRIRIYYLVSNGTNGELDKAQLDNKQLFTLNSTRFLEILAQTENTYLSELSGVYTKNTKPSTSFNTFESVEQIKRNAPAAYRSQFRLVTSNDFETYIKTNYASLVTDVVCMNNTDFMDSYVKYFYDLGISDIMGESRAFVNQMNFAQANNFNNIYLFIAPKNRINGYFYVPSAAKNLIKNGVEKAKILTSEIVFADPVYEKFSIATNTPNKNPDISDITESGLILQKQKNSQRSSASLKKEAVTIITNYFSSKENLFGQTYSAADLHALLLAIDGVGKVFTVNGATRISGVMLYHRNPVYDFSMDVLTGTLILEDFKIGFLDEDVDLNNIVAIENFDGSSQQTFKVS